MLAAYSPFALIRSAVRRRLFLSHIHCVVLAFPAIFFEPKEGESNAAFLLLGQSNIHELDANRCFLRFRIIRVQPVVAGLVQQKWRVRLYSQERARRHGSHLMIRFPDLNGLAFAVPPNVPLVCWVN